MITLYEIGKPFPGPVPKHDGATFELGPDGDMVLLIQFQKPSTSESAALKNGFSKYAYYEQTGNLSLACWVFKFPAPVLYIEAPFHAGLYKDDRASKFLADKAANALSVFVLDGTTLTILRHSGLQTEAMRLFHNTVNRQIQEKAVINPILYNAEINRLYQRTTEDIFQYGNIFAHKELQK